MQSLVGRVLKQRYQVIQFIGQGGMADVYKVWDITRSTYLAMKVLSENLAEDKMFLRRFKHEAHILAALEHPSIVRMYELEEDGDLVFILMDFIDGSSLQREIKETPGPFLPQRILEIMRRICPALDYAHRSNIVHCDIKSGNILEDLSGQTFLSDFGISRMTDVTVSAAPVAGAGTPTYMAPEQINGDSPTPKMDIYALGVLLFELVTGGKRPFNGDYANIQGTPAEKVRWEHLYIPPPTPRQFNSAVPESVERIILACLQKDPALRFASTMDLLAALERALGEMIAHRQTMGGKVRGSYGYPVSPPPPPAYPGPAAAKRPIPPWIWVTGAAVLIAILAAIPVFGGALSKTTQTPSPSAATRISPAARTSPAAITRSAYSTGTPVLTITRSVSPSSTITLTPIIPSKTFTPSRSPSSTPASTGFCSSSLACTSIGSKCRSQMDQAEMVCVPAGNFNMGSSPNDPMVSKTDEQPKHPVFLNAFWIAKTEVTNRQFSLCVAAGACVKPHKNEPDNLPEYYGNPAYDNYPVVYVEWSNAERYCKWAAGRLPTEAEWEKAARGSADDRSFPWGYNQPNNQLANYGNSIASITTTGSFTAGASPYGALDMAGNAAEWVSDNYDKDYYSKSPYENPQGPSGGSIGILRGGSFISSPDKIRTADRYALGKIYSGANYGFRCVLP